MLDLPTTTATSTGRKPVVIKEDTFNDNATLIFTFDGFDRYPLIIGAAKVRRLLDWADVNGGAQALYDRLKQFADANPPKEKNRK